jgi:hypothetical protein
MRLAHHAVRSDRPKALAQRVYLPNIGADASTFAKSVTSTLGYDGLRILADRILADRILADRILANRGFRHWGRLPARQVGGGSNAQHGEGCCRREHDRLHHDLIPLSLINVTRAAELGPPRRATAQRLHHFTLKTIQ